MDPFHSLPYPGRVDPAVMFKAGQSLAVGGGSAAPFAPAGRVQSGKPAQVVAKMVECKVEKYAAEVCLLEQDYIKEPGKAVRQVVNDAISKLGENITVRRFVRFRLGEGIDQRKGDDGKPDA